MHGRCHRQHHCFEVSISTQLFRFSLFTPAKHSHHVLRSRQRQGPARGAHAQRPCAPHAAATSCQGARRFALAHLRAGALAACHGGACGPGALFAFDRAPLRAAWRARARLPARKRRGISLRVVHASCGAIALRWEAHHDHTPKRPKPAAALSACVPSVASRAQPHLNITDSPRSILTDPCCAVQASSLITKGEPRRLPRDGSSGIPRRAPPAPAALHATPPSSAS